MSGISSDYSAKVKFDTSDAGRNVDSLREKLAKLREEAAKFGALPSNDNVPGIPSSAPDTIGKVEAAYRRVVTAIDPVTTAENKLKTAHSILDETLKNGLISQTRHAELLGLATQKYGVSTAALEKTESGLSSFASKLSEVGQAVGLFGGETAEAFAKGAEGAAGFAERSEAVLASVGPLLPLVIALGVALFAIGAAVVVFDVLKDITEEGIKTEAIVAQLNQTLKSNGSYSGLSAHDMVEYADSLSVATGKSKDLIIQLETNLARFSKLDEDGFKKATQFALDYAQVSGVGIPEAGNKMGAILEGNSKSITKLKDIGIVLSAGQKKTMQDMIDTGNIAGFQAKIFELLQEKIGGAANAYANTLAGSIGKARNELLLAKEAIASEILPALNDLLNDLVRNAGGWENLHKTIQEFAHDVGDRIRILIYVIATSYEQWKRDNDSLAANIQNVFAEIFGAIAKFASGMSAISNLTGNFAAGAAFAQIAKSTTAEVDKMTEATAKYAQSSLAHGIAILDLTNKLTAHKLALQGDTDVTNKGIPVEDTIAKKQKDHAGILAELAKALQSYNDKLADSQYKLALNGEQQDRLFESLKSGLAAYEQTKAEITSENAVLAISIERTKEHRTQLEALEAIRKKAADAHDAAGATAAQAAIDKENDSFPATLKGLQDTTEANIKKGKAINDNVAIDKLNLSLEDEQVKAEAALADARTQTSSATAQLNILLDARAKALATGLILDSDDYNAEVASIIIAKQKLEVTKQQIDAIDLLNASSKQINTEQAKQLDWQSQQEAIKAYGKDIAGILIQYGLLSQATEKLQIEEEVLAEIRKQNLDIEDENNVLIIDGIWNQVTQTHKALLEIKQAYADADIAKYVNQPIVDGVKAWKDAGISAFNSWVETGTFDAKSFEKTFLDITIKMIEEWLARWYAAIAAKTAAEIAGNQAAAASQANGGVTGNTGLSSFVTGPGGGAQASGGSGAGAGASSGTAGLAAMGATIAVFAAIYFVALNWLQHHQREFEQIRIGAGGPGSLGSSLGSITAGADHLGAVADEMIKTVSGIVNGLGGVIEGWTGDLTVSRSGHGKSTQYWVQFANGMIERFGNDAAAAVQFATVQALRQSNIGGLPAEVQRAIHDSAATTVDQINAEITQAYQDVANRLGTVGQQVYDIFRKYATSITDRLKQAFTDIQSELLALHPGGGGSGLGGSVDPNGPGSGDGPSGGFGFETDNAKSAAIAKVTDQQSQAIQASIQAITDEIAARNREVDSIRNSILGVNDAGSKRLADLLSFDRGIEESRNLVSAQVQLVQQQLADLGSKGGAAADKLRAALNDYLAQLQKMPDEITGVQKEMVVFDVLDQYLQHSHKYAKEEMEFARIKVEIEFAAIKAQIILLGLWDKYAKMFQDAYNAAMAAAGKGGGGGSGGGNRKQDEQSVRDAIAQSKLTLANDSYLSSLAGINKTYDDLIPKAHKDKELLAEIAAQREAEIAALRKQTADKLAADVAAYTTNARGTDNPWQTQLDATNKQAADLRAEYIKTSTDLGFSAPRIARGLAAIDAANLAHAQAIDNAAIKSLNLPMEQTRDQIKTLSDTMSFLRDSVTRGTLSLQRYNEILSEVGQQATLDVLGRMANLLDQEGRFDDADKLRRAQDQINFEINLAQLNFLYNQYVALGYISKEMQKTLGPLLAWIDDPVHQPNWDLPAPQRPSASSASSSSSANSTFANAVQTFKSATDNLLSSFQSLFGTNSTLGGSAQERLGVVQSNFQGIESAALAGDVNARAKYGQAAQDYLTVLNEANAGGALFAAERERIKNEFGTLFAQTQFTLDGIVYDARLGAPIAPTVNYGGLGYTPTGGVSGPSLPVISGPTATNVANQNSNSGSSTVDNSALLTQILVAIVNLQTTVTPILNSVSNNTSLDHQDNQSMISTLERLIVQLRAA